MQVNDVRTADGQVKRARVEQFALKSPMRAWQTLRLRAFISHTSLETCIHTNKTANLPPPHFLQSNNKGMHT